jgi:hypothetical protein
VAYATPTQLRTYLGGAKLPDDALRMLERATEIIDEILVGVVYSVDASGNPTNDDDEAALADAVCAQVEWWIETDDEFGLASQFSSVSIGNVSLVRANSATKGATANRVAPRALGHLRVRGLNPKPGTRVLSTYESFFEAQ